MNAGFFKTEKANKIVYERLSMGIFKKKIGHSNYIEVCAQNTHVWNILEDSQDYSVTFDVKLVRISYNLPQTKKRLVLLGPLSPLKWVIWHHDVICFRDHSCFIAAVWVLCYFIYAST